MELHAVRMFGASAAFSLLFFAASVGIASASTVEYSTELRPIGTGIHNHWARVPDAPEGNDFFLVKESVCNAATDYVYKTGVGSADEQTSFRVSLGGIPAGAVITNITVKPCASNTTKVTKKVPAANVSAFIMLGSQVYEGAPVALTGTTPAPITPTVFNDANYTVQGNENAYIGVRYSSGKAGVRLSSISVEITYEWVPGEATADLKINGSDGPITLAHNQPITVTWSSEHTNASSCSLHGVKEEVDSPLAYILNVPTSGTLDLYAYVPSYTPYFMLLRCFYTLPGQLTPQPIDDRVYVIRAE